MNLQNIKIKIFLLKMFIVYVAALNPAPLSSLKRICCIERGTDEIIALPNKDLCTSVAVYSDNDEERIHKVIDKKYGLPIVYIIKHFEYDEIKEKIKHEEHKFNTLLTKTINDYNISTLILDNLYPPPTTIGEYDYDEKFQKGINDLFSIMKNRHKNVIFGMALSKDNAAMKNAFNLEIIDKVIDVYFPQTLSYVQCSHKGKQIYMANTSPLENMEATLMDLSSLGFSLTKSIPLIRVVVNTVRHGNADAEDDMSYATLCSSTPGKRRKYCLETLPNFYNKGYLVYKYNMIGCFIQSIDRDDYNDSCDCGEYPVLRSIIAGMSGKPASKSLVECDSFAVHK